MCCVCCCCAKVPCPGSLWLSAGAARPPALVHFGLAEHHRLTGTTDLSRVFVSWYILLTAAPSPMASTPGEGLPFLSRWYHEIEAALLSCCLINGLILIPGCCGLSPSGTMWTPTDGWHALLCCPGAMPWRRSRCRSASLQRGALMGTGASTQQSASTRGRAGKHQHQHSPSASVPAAGNSLSSHCLYPVWLRTLLHRKRTI